MSSISDSTSERNAERPSEQTLQGANGAHVHNHRAAPNGVLAAQPNGNGKCNQPAASAPNATAAIADGEAACELERNASYARALAAYKAANFGRAPLHAETLIVDPAHGRVHRFAPEGAETAAQSNPEHNAAIELMLLHAIHLPDVFTLAKRLLPASDLGCPGESAHQAIWEHACNYYDRTGHLPDYEVLVADIERDLRALGEHPVLVYRKEDTLNLARWLYVDAVKPTHVDEGLRLLREFLVRRKYDRPMKGLLEQPRHPRRAELEAQYAEVRRKVEEACQVDTPDTDVSLEALVSGTYSHNWLIRNVLVEGSPMIVGGPKKALKTSVLLDLAVSLGAGEGATFLNHYRFRVEKRGAVGMYSGESNAPTVATTVRNICASKNRKPAEAAVYLQFATPKLSADGDLAAIQAFIKRRNLKVIIFDPAYTSLLKGNAKASASNVFDMGEVLSKITEACLAAGATPIFAHHTVKHAGKKPGRNGTLYQSYEPAELGDLAFAGFAEFARQWLLIARRADYEPGTGKHGLWITTGGSAGFNGCYAVDIDEGVMTEDFSGKKWDVCVQTQAEASRNQVSARVDAAAVREQEDRQRVLSALTQHGGREGITLNKLVPHTRMRRSAVERHLAVLSDSSQVEICGCYRGGDLWRASCWNV